MTSALVLSTSSRAYADVLPLHPAGCITNMEAFLAFLEHVHGMLTTTYHNTPIILMASPQWTRPDCETIARYIFEKTKTPAMCLIHSGIATQYGLKHQHMTVVDVGYEKVDVTCIYDSRVVAHTDLGRHAPENDQGVSGGEVFTRKLLSLLEDKGFNYEMAEQLKKSNICEVLPYVPDTSGLVELPEDSGAAVAAAGDKVADADDPDGENRVVDDEGVLDVANIVASGNTREFLAKQEKLKAEKAKAGRKGKEKEAAEAEKAKAQRLPNAKKARNVFHYEHLVTEEVTITPTPKTNGASKDVAMTDAGAGPSGAATETPVEATAADKSAETATEAPKDPATSAAPSTAGGDATKSEEAKSEEAKPEAVGEQPAATTGSEAQPAANPASEVVSTTEMQTRRVRRDIEIGVERFLFADREEIDRIVTAIYRAIQSIEDMFMRPQCWDNIVFVGNGARIRGLKDNIMQTLQARHLVSPSSATMFTSELPSNLATPSGTGSQTPTGSFTGAPHQLPTASSVNPLLQAATTANLGIPGAATTTAGSNAGDAAPSHHFHSQTPTSIKQATLPTYLSEWTKNGFEEAMFLGAQVAARLAFCIHNLDVQGQECQRLMSLTRVDYK